MKPKVSKTTTHRAKRIPKADQQKLADACDTVLSAISNPLFCSRMDIQQRAMIKQMELFLMMLKKAMGAKPSLKDAKVGDKMIVYHEAVVIDSSCEKKRSRRGKQVR